MKILILIMFFLIFTILLFNLLENYYNKIYYKNKIIFWINSFIINLLIPYIVILLISIKINNYFISELHNAKIVLLISIVTNAFLYYKLQYENKHEK